MRNIQRYITGTPNSQQHCAAAKCVGYNMQEAKQHEQQPELHYSNQRPTVNNIVQQPATLQRRKLGLTTDIEFSDLKWTVTDLAEERRYQNSKWLRFEEIRLKSYSKWRRFEEIRLKTYSKWLRFEEIRLKSYSKWLRFKETRLNSYSKW
ncbi:hypothetical protein HAX54_032026 [Datura stramonium]|uniref:Uncharacterized protein n=1 Tax=Datura stramonium TaxID=4076 RepID=A0ABS8VB35_DATST|nr:hypothetical protein [Datura stramonium]